MFSDSSFSSANANRVFRFYWTPSIYRAERWPMNDDEASGWRFERATLISGECQQRHSLFVDNFATGSILNGDDDQIKPTKMLPYAYSQLQQAALNYQQQQLFGLDRMRFAAAHGTSAGPYILPGYPGLDLGYRAFDPRTARFVQEEPKPQHSYIGLIAMAILSNADKKMVLSDIYQWILDHYPYFRSRGPGWRNSIRHNLSLNDCFIKAGRSANGKGHYWAIHPANVEDFKKGDFRRRRAQRKVRKHMGLSVANEEDESDDSPCVSPSLRALVSAPCLSVVDNEKSEESSPTHSRINLIAANSPSQPKKRIFDVESLLAPDCKKSESPISDLIVCADDRSLSGHSALAGASSVQLPSSNSFFSPVSHWQLQIPYISACSLSGPWFKPPIASPITADSYKASEESRCSPDSISPAKWQVHKCITVFDCALLHIIEIRYLFVGIICKSSSSILSRSAFVKDNRR